MANKVITTTQANKDITRINRSNEMFSGLAFAQETLKKVAEAIYALAQNDLIPGSPITGLDAKYRKWTIVQNRYVIYFRRTRQNNLRVIAIRGTREKSLTSEEILQADK
jgi:plasmid stabilization system protein ParE